MKGITPCLWFDDNAEEAVNFYASTFKNSKSGNITRYGEAGSDAAARPKGSVMTITFHLDGQEFMALNGGPMFKFTPAISFFVNCKTEKEINELWHKLSEGGIVLMELDQYPFSEKFGWLQDKFGISWQLTLADRAQKIVPFLMFVGKQHGKAEEAINFYTSLFQDSTIQNVEYYEKGEEEPEGTVKHAVFSINGQEFMAIDSNRAHPFTFTPAISLIVNCETQTEVDNFWEKFSKGGEIEQCGWLKDRFGVSWQIVPVVLQKMLENGDPVKSESVMKAMLQMKKLEINTLKQAFEQQHG